jgi:CBS domain-containing protein
MTATIDRLASLRVADVMSRQVVPVYAHQTMAEAAAVFIEHGISGAPVLDDQGRCIGILSAADFVRRQGAARSGSSFSACNQVVVRSSHDGPWQVEDVYEDRVTAHMSAAVQTVEAEAPLADAARIMCAQHIHRVPVLDQHGYPVGMITALDVAAAFLQAADEARGRLPREVVRSTPTQVSFSERQRAANLYRKHLGLRNRLDAVRTAIRCEQDPSRLVAMLEELVSGAYEHFRYEEDCGCFDDAFAGTPQLADRASVLLLQHPALMDALRELLELARYAGPREALAARFEAVVKEWLAHEDKENELLLEAYTMDIGTKD